MFDVSMKRKWDNFAVLEGAKMEGRKETRSAIVKSLIEGTDFSDEKIAELISVSPSFVQNVKEELQRE